MGIRMKNKKIKILIISSIFFAIAGLGWWSLFSFTGPQIMKYEYQRDHHALREIFDRDWDWLIPFKKDEYSLDMFLKYRAPQQNPLFAGRMQIYVVRDGDQLIGFIAYYMKNPEAGFLNFLDINPEFRGKGYSKQLVQHALDDMISHGARSITIVTYPHNAAALKLYTGFGFVEIRRDSQVELEYVPLQ